MPGEEKNALRDLLNEKRYVSDKDISVFLGAIRILSEDIGDTGGSCDEICLIA